MSFPFENTHSIAALDGNAVLDFMKISFNTLCAKHEGLTCLCGAAVRNSWTSLVALCLRSVERLYGKLKKSSQGATSSTSSPLLKTFDSSLLRRPSTILMRLVLILFRTSSFSEVALSATDENADALPLSFDALGYEKSRQICRAEIQPRH